MKNIVTFCPFCVILFQLFVAVSMNLCTDIDGEYTCCQGYRFDHAQNKCIPCDKGFYGTNCDIKCKHPTYGKDCQSLCDCNATHIYCHHANGCIQTSDFQIQSTVHMSFMYRPVTKKLKAIDDISCNERFFFNITSDNITNINTPICDTKKRPSKGIKMLLFGIIGLTALSFIIYMMYLYTRVLENRRMNTGTA